MFPGVPTQKDAGGKCLTVVDTYSVRPQADICLRCLFAEEQRKHTVLPGVRL